jgi:T-box
MNKTNKLSQTYRRMFPTVRVSFSGPLRGQPSDRYAVLLDIVAVDSRRYRYAYHRSSWLVAGKADPPPPARLYSHPDTPLGADALRKQVISFEKVKLTNNEMDKNGQVSCFFPFPSDEDLQSSQHTFDKTLAYLDTFIDVHFCFNSSNEGRRHRQCVYPVCWNNFSSFLTSRQRIIC